MLTCFCRQTQMLHQAFIHHRRCLACLISLHATPFTHSQAGGCFTFGSAHAGQPTAILMRMQDGGNTNQCTPLSGWKVCNAA